MNLEKPLSYIDTEIYLDLDIYPIFSKKTSFYQNPLNI
jgi:hypothetical protein